MWITVQSSCNSWEGHCSSTWFGRKTWKPATWARAPTLWRVNEPHRVSWLWISRQNLRQWIRICLLARSPRSAAHTCTFMLTKPWGIIVLNCFPPVRTHVLVNVWNGWIAFRERTSDPTFHLQTPDRFVVSILGHRLLTLARWVGRWVRKCWENKS